MQIPDIRLRYFEKKDIPLKVRWLNDPEVNQFLHYDLPLSEDRTMNWYQKIMNDSSRADFVIDVAEDGQVHTVGLIGLLSIDSRSRKGEFYITLGEKDFQGKGIALQASRMFLDYCYKRYDLNRIYLYTEEKNIRAQRLFEKIGFEREGLLKEDLIFMGNPVSRYVYGQLRKDFYHDAEDASLL